MGASNALLPIPPLRHLVPNTALSHHSAQPTGSNKPLNLHPSPPPKNYRLPYPPSYSSPTTNRLLNQRLSPIQTSRLPLQPCPLPTHATLPTPKWKCQTHIPTSSSTTTLGSSRPRNSALPQLPIPRSTRQKKRS